MNKQELLQRVGSMQQMAYVRPLIMEEGRAKGMKLYDIKNNRLQFQLMADKCLDISGLSYRGENLCFLSKPGLAGPASYDTNGAEAQRSIMGGMLFTCGLENICAPCTVAGKEYPMHGRIRTTPAEHIVSKAYWHEDRYCMEVSGEMRQAELFGENLVLRRKVQTQFPEPKITITDEICNESFRQEPFMLLYHFNIGYPLLSEDCEIILPSLQVTARDARSEPGLSNWQMPEAPVDNQEEYVFLHKLAADKAGNTFAAVINKNLGFGLKLSFQQKNLPWFMEWKSLASGDYVLGLEPANASVYGKQYHLERGDHPMLEPMETIQTGLEITIIEETEFADLAAEAEKLAEMEKGEPL